MSHIFLSKEMKSQEQDIIGGGGENYIKTGSSPVQVDCNETDKMLKRSEVEAIGMLEMCVGGQDRCRVGDILGMV